MHVLKDINDEFNENWDVNDHVHPRTVQRIFHDHDYKWRVVMKKDGRFWYQQEKACCLVFKEKENLRLMIIGKHYISH
jgi:hypothetical protein